MKRRAVIAFYPIRSFGLLAKTYTAIAWGAQSRICPFAHRTLTPWAVLDENAVPI
jgi:hypothetical protein